MKLVSKIRCELKLQLQLQKKKICQLGRKPNPFLRLTQTYLLLLCRNFKFFLEKNYYCSNIPIDTGEETYSTFLSFITLSKMLASSSCQNLMWFRWFCLYDIILESPCCGFDFTICINVGSNIFMKLVFKYAVN